MTEMSLALADLCLAKRNHSTDPELTFHEHISHFSHSAEGFRFQRGCVEFAGDPGRKGGNEQELMVKWDGCQQHFTEKRLHLLYCMVAHRINWETRGL